MYGYFVSNATMLELHFMQYVLLDIEFLMVSFRYQHQLARQRKQQLFIRQHNDNLYHSYIIKNDH